MNKELISGDPERERLEIEYTLAVYLYRLLTLEDALLGLEKGISPIEAWK